MDGAIKSKKKVSVVSLLQRAKVLSPRQTQVLKLIASGSSNKEVARRLGISERTVETHREQLMNRLDIRGTAGLTKFALLIGLLDPH